MPRHADLAAQLLKEAADFFRVVARQNDSVTAQLLNNAAVYDKASALIAAQPEGASDGKTHAAMASELLKEGAEFFRKLGEKNPPLNEQMAENARVFEGIADLVAANPLGVMD